MRIHLFSKCISYKKFVAAVVAVCLSVLSVAPPAFSQTAAPMPAPGVVVHPSPENDPLLLRGLRVYLDDPFRLDFIVDENRQGPEVEDLRLDSIRSITYFLTALTIPRGDLWVNLSPFEQDRIVPDALGQTALGRDLLAQDYLLKQLTASFIHPDDTLGKLFWDKVYRESFERYGTTDIPLDTFHKVWVVPGSAGVYEDNDRVIVVENQLKVMLEEDYMAARETGKEQQAAGQAITSAVPGQDVSTQIMREVIVPAIEREVNQGENFAVLRQIYQAIILANWYKQRVEDAVLKDKYVDQRKLGGIDLNDPEAKRAIYRQYVEAFQKGVYELIREENDPYTQELIPRKYFSGGFSLGELNIQRHSPKNTAPSTVSGWFEKLAARAQKGARSILLSVLLLAYPVGASAADAVGTNALLGLPPTNASAEVQSPGDVDAMLKKLGEMSKKGSLSTNEISGLFQLLSGADKINKDIYNLAREILLKNRGTIFEDQDVLRSACMTLLAVQDIADPEVESEVKSLSGLLESLATERFQEARAAYNAKQARQNGPKKILSSLSGDELKNFTQAMQGDFRLWINQLKASPTNAQFAPLFDFISQGENLDRINDLIVDLPRTEMEARTLVSNILARLTEAGVLAWGQSGPGVWKTLWVKDANAKVSDKREGVLWQSSPSNLGPAPTLWESIQNHKLLGIFLVGLGFLFVPVIKDLWPDAKVKVTALREATLDGGTLVPGMDAKLAAIGPAPRLRPVTMRDPKALTGDRQVIDMVKGLSDDVIKELRNEDTLKILGRIRSDEPLLTSDIADARAYLGRRYGALKGWETRARKAYEKWAAARAAIFPQTVEQQQFADSFEKLLGHARQQAKDALDDTSRALWEGRATALGRLRGFVLARYRSAPQQMILGKINPQDSPEEFLTRLVQKLTIPEYKGDPNQGDALVMDKNALMRAEVKDNTLILTPNAVGAGQPITLPLSGDKGTAELVERATKYSTEAGRSDFFDIPWTRRLPLLNPKFTLGDEVRSYLFAEELQGDRAMKRTPVGGIDLNDNLLNVRSTGAGPRIRLKFEVDADRAVPIEGFIPQVLSIQPMDLQAFFAAPAVSQP